jgi:hypothetical protein
MSARAPRLLLIESEPGFAAGLRGHESLSGCVVEDGGGEADALRRLRRRAYDLVITSPREHAARDEPGADPIAHVEKHLQVAT